MRWLRTLTLVGLGYVAFKGYQKYRSGRKESA
jgi:uncharacterized membrane protein YebE (DUF533 family)